MSQHPKHCICFYCQKHHPENAKYRDTLLGDCLRLQAAVFNCGITVKQAALNIKENMRDRSAKRK